MSPHHTPVHKVDFPLDFPTPIRTRLRCGKGAAPHPCLAPAPKPAVDRLPLPVALRHIPPRRSCAQHPQNPVDHLPVFQRRPPRSGLLRRQQRRKGCPLLICQFVSSYRHAHILRLNTSLQTRPSFPQTHGGKPQWKRGPASPSYNRGPYISVISPAAGTITIHRSVWLHWPACRNAACRAKLSSVPVFRYTRVLLWPTSIAVRYARVPRARPEGS
jgi:hypothetical protein